MSKIDPTDLIQSDAEKLAIPVQCTVCGTQIEDISSDSLIPLTQTGKPCCDKHRGSASVYATIKHHHGYPWNGIHPETGETQALRSTEWYEVVETKQL